MTKKYSVLSLLAALVLLVTLFPAQAAAGGQVAVSQEGVTYYYDASGNRLTNASSLSGNAVVEMKKWAEQRKDVSGNPIENEFMVTLQVRTTERIEELSADTPDAAVTLVVDVSNSMDDCYHCGQEASHDNHASIGYKCPGNRNTYFSGSSSYSRCTNCNQRFRDHVESYAPPKCEYESRLSQAQAAALDFINQFANETGAEEGDKRYAALITFGAHAAARTQYIDVATASGMLAMELAIKNITVANSGVSFSGNTTDGGGTNIEGGLMLADNMIAANTAAGRDLNGIQYLYTILLTDGNPTYYVNGDNTSTSTIVGTRGGGSSTTRNDVKDVGVEAAKILAHSPQSRLFSICFGTDSTGDNVWDKEPFETWNDANPPTKKSDSVGDWLLKFSSAAFDASNLDGGLFDSFGDVITQIQLAAQAWHVNDQMGPHINYLGANLVSTGSGVIRNDISFSGDTMKWNILGSQPDPRLSSVTTQGGVTTGILGYTCQYFISLNNLDDNYTNKTAATDANTKALLTYATKNDDDEWKIVKDVLFPVPEVKGLTGTFTFKKINEEDEALPGIQFTLRDMVDGVDYTRTAVSDANGMVTFTNIPSGHSYRLDEQTGPEYLDLGDIRFDISWGEVTPKSANIQGSAANGYVIVNEYSEHALSGLTLKKVFRGDMPEDAHYVEFTLRGARNHNMNYVQTIRLNNQNNWQNTFANLDPGWYTLHEETSFEGYDNTLSITYQVMENGQLVTKNLLDDNGDGSYDIHLNAMGQYTEYTATVINELKQHTGDVTIRKSFWDHDLTVGTDNHMEGLTQIAADLYDHITVTVSATPQGASAPLQTITLNKNNNFTAKFDDLPAGVYTLSETVSGDVKDHAFEHSLFLRNGQEVTRTLTVNKNDQISLELQNHYRHYLGHIRVEKVVIGDLATDSPLLRDKTFTVDVWSVDEKKFVDTLYLTAEHDWVDSTALIPVGRYHLVEKTENGAVEVDGYTWLEDESTLSGDVVQGNDAANSIVVVVSPSEDAYVAKTVILTNVYEQQLGSLTVKKAFAGDSDLQKEYFAENDYGFEIFVEGPNQYSNTIYLNKDNNWEETIADLPIGRYSVTERANVDGYIHTFEITNHGMVDITDKGEAVITITNKYKEILGGLIVEKTYMLRGADRDTVLSQDMKHLLHDARVEVTATHKETGESFTQILDSHNDFKTAFTGLSLGEYTLTEKELSALPGYHLVEHTFAPASLTVENGTDNPKAFLTNVYARDTGSITVEKQFAPGSDLDRADFESKGLSIALTFTSEDGVSVKEDFFFNRVRGWSKTFTDLPSGKYYISETARVAGYDLEAVITVNGRPVTDGLIEITNNGDDIKVIITNKYSQQKGALEVQKSFVDENGRPFAANQLSSFRVKVTAVSTLDASITGSVILDAANGFKARIENLPIGNYALSEEILVGSIPDYSLISASFNPATADITKNGTALITLTNVYGRDLGSLKVEKVFGNGSHLTQKDFEDKNLSITITVTGANFKEEITLNKTNGWSKILTDLPTGQYQVTEGDASVPGYTLDVQITNGGAATVVKGQMASVTCTNTYTTIVGGLQVTKQFKDESGAALAAELYKDVTVTITATAVNNPAVSGTVTLNAGNGFSGGISELPVGDYKLTEKVTGEIAGYTFVDSVFAPETVTVTETAVASSVLTNTYTRDLGSLTIQKLFGENSDLTQEDFNEKNLSIQFTVTSQNDPAFREEFTFNKANGWIKTLNNLPTGYYQVTESANVENYILSADLPNNGLILVEKNGNANFICTNTYTAIVGGLQVTKQFKDASGAALAAELYKDVTVTITATAVNNPAVSGTVTLNAGNGFSGGISELPVGDYKLTEKVTGEIAGYTFVDSVFAPETVTVTETAVASSVLTNTYTRDLGSLTIQKLFGENSDLTQEDFNEKNLSIQFTVTSQNDPAFREEFTFNKANGWIKTLNNLPTGYYQVTESANVENYILSADLPNNGLILVEKNGNANFICTNTYTTIVGGLQVSKQFKDASGAALAAELYKDVTVTVTATAVNNPAVSGAVTLNVANSFSGGISNLPVGDYKLTEKVTGEIAGYTFVGSVFAPETVTVTETAVATAVLTNTYTRDTGSIIVEKHFDADSALSKEDFEADNLSIQVTITGVDDPAFERKITLNKENEWKQTVTGLPTGKYRITEAAQMDGYALTATITGAQVTDGVVTLEKDARALVIITNLYDPHMGGLIIHKQLTGDTEKAPDELIFIVTGADGTSQTVTVKRENNWIATLSLPIGEYTVAEQVENGEDYRVHTVMNPADGKVTITDGQTVTVTCTNDYETLMTVRIPVEKTVVQTGNIAPGHNTFAFQAVVKAPAGVTWMYQNDSATAGGELHGIQNADSFYIAVQDAATVKGWIVMTGYPSDLNQATVTLKETSEYATAEDAANANWILDDTVFGSAEWNVSFDEQGRPAIRRSDAAETSDAVAFTNTCTAYKETPPPETGDGSMPLLWMGTAITALCGIVILMIRKRKEG